MVTMHLDQNSTSQLHCKIHSWTKNLLADCLSRLGNQEDTIKLPKLHVYQIFHQLPARSDSLQEIRQATQADDGLVLLKHTIMTE